MALSKYTVRCIKQMTPEGIDREFGRILMESYSVEEEMWLVVAANAAMLPPTTA